MARIRNRKMILIVIALCLTVVIITLSQPHPHYLPTYRENSNFNSKKNITWFWRNSKFTFDEPLADDAEDWTDEYLEYRQKGGSHHHRKKHDNPVKQVIKSNFKARLWFMKDGKIRPKPSEENTIPLLWPEQDVGDRIIEQLMYVPPNYPRSVYRKVEGSKRKILKTILLYYGTKGFANIYPGRRVFIKDKCPVNTCAIFFSLRDSDDFDAIIFSDRFTPPAIKRTVKQLWILYLLESPVNTPRFKNLKHIINWTATYRHDSDIVTPYGKFVPYNTTSADHMKQMVLTHRADGFKHLANKTKKVSWFVSNCAAKNLRLQYAYELGHYIDVDVYGACGRFQCKTESCFDMLDRDYKFYLSFENSNCDEYITEKFFRNGLRHNVVPIVMGASREEYSRVAPPHSYIHVDDFKSPKDLAEYLHLLDRNDTLYNAYFNWKGTGEFINTYFWCRLCAMLHAPLKQKSYADIYRWWSKPGTCDVTKRVL